ncbi:MAG: bifunctional diguanylate cyclase/phosphodiesterase [Gammaproteobacteria bacterium]|nr:bifunctional diguanylate cyclase/phosphodiesterase [Gammaproteobacteria bacterium]
MDRDPLTGLPDRHTFFRRLESQIKCCGQFGDLMGVVVVNLRQFRDINREYGYQVGDTLLQEAANRIREALRQSDTVARLGADEFALLLPGMVNPGHAQLAAHKIERALSEPFLIDGLRLRLRSYAGIALFPQHAANAQQLMQAVDRALIEARETVTSCEFFGEHLDVAKPSLLALENDLQDAIERNELRLYLQPQIDMDRSRVAGFECLSRWHHPERGEIPPDQFIALAEQTGQIEALTLWSLKAALHHLKMLQHLQPQLTMSVNLSAAILHHPDIVDLVQQALAVWNTAPGSLVLEVTEGAMMQQPDRGLEVLRRLQALGVGLSIDDFGTGYSSLAYLKRLPVHELKIDKSFVVDLDRSEEDERIVRTIISLAHNFGMRVVAEGVENQAILEQLANLGCDLAQGRHIAMAMRVDDAAAWLSRPAEQAGIAQVTPSIARHS